MLSSPAHPGAKSGIIITETGERRIPSSVRSDGSKRKEIKIRPGYKPPEDVEIYKNRTAEAWKTRGTGGIPGAASTEGIPASDNKPSNGKNAKRREARKRAKASEEGANEGDDTVDCQFSTSSAPKRSSKLTVTESENWRASTPALDPIGPDSDAEKEKLARNLKKKLRQARELREKKDKGDSLLPEQFEKVIKINELIRQLDGLGFGADGEPKNS